MTNFFIRHFIKQKFTCLLYLIAGFFVKKLNKSCVHLPIISQSINKEYN